MISLMSFPSFFEQVAARLNAWPEPPTRLDVEGGHEEGEVIEERLPANHPRPTWVDPSDGRRAASWAFRSRGESEPLTSVVLGGLAGDPTASSVLNHEVDDMYVDFMDRRT